MSQKRAEKLLRRAKRHRKRMAPRTTVLTNQRFEDALKIAEVICKHGGVVYDDKTGEVTKMGPRLMEAYRAGRLREALQEQRRRRA